MFEVFAIREIFQFVDRDQEDESNDRQSRRHGNSDADDDCVADYVSHDRQQSTKKGQTNYKSLVLKRDGEHKYRRQERVYGRNPDLSTHDCFKTLVEQSETNFDFIGYRGEKVWPLRPIGKFLDPRIQKQADRNDDSY